MRTTCAAPTRSLQKAARSPVIRPATLADVPALMALEKHAATAAHWSAEQYQAMFSSTPPRVALITETENSIHGFLIARAVGREWELENLAIASHARRRGLATQLLGEFLNTARSLGATAVFLEVRASNSAARRLYEKWAFIECGRRAAYYRDPEEAAITYRLDFS
jgi:ribosomal-protein-alanine acetyltransferase